MSHISPSELLQLEIVPAGTIRHTIHNEDGTTESCAVNNLSSIISTYSCDFIGNKFGGYFIVPKAFFRILKKELKQVHSKNTDWLAKNEHGGIMGVFSYFTIYVEDVDKVYMKSDVGEVVFEFTVGDTHDILRKDKAVELLGWEKFGFDVRLPYVPQLERFGNAYAPIALLQEWTNDGFTPAQTLLLNPPQEALDQWWNQGQIDAPTKEAMPKMLEAPKND